MNEIEKMQEEVREQERKRRREIDATPGGEEAYYKAVNLEHYRDCAIKAQNECNRLKGELQRANVQIAELESATTIIINEMADVETTARLNASLLETERARNTDLQKRLQKALSRLTARGDELPLEPTHRGRRKLFKTKGGK